MQMNRVVIASYVTKKPEVRCPPSGIPATNVGVGESVRYADGSWQTWEHTNWHSLSFYRGLAAVALVLEKGDNVYTDGRIEQRQFTPSDGSKLRTVHDIVVSQCHVIAPRGSANKMVDTARRDAANGSRSAGAGVENDWSVVG